MPICRRCAPSVQGLSVTASYARLRRAILAGQIPSPHMVRTEEVINAFAYDYPAPTTPDTPFRATTTVTDSPWTEGAHLLHIGIQGYAPRDADRPAANLVFLVDASGSMAARDKLPLLVRSLEMLLGQLAPDDTVSIVTYAGSAGVVLAPTPARDGDTIRDALARIHSGGATAGAAGIEAAYDLAQQAFIDGGANRVILATDGDFNLGVSDPKALERLIAQKRKTGIFLSVLGVGTGNLRDDTMQALAQAGNGTAAYLDSLREARRVLVEQVSGMLFTIAKDVKLQVEFNPAQVSQYRLLGHKTRALARANFDNGRVDAGEIGAGHRVTAIYEIRRPHGVTPPGRHGAEEVAPLGAHTEELAFLKIRHKAPDSGTNVVSETPILADVAIPLQDAPAGVRFSIAAAVFAEKLRGTPALADTPWSDIAALARSGLGDDPMGRRRELIDLI
ncbi:MAG: von Willebrand factor type A domain-containing protein [Pseudomonadota bacterium]